MSARASIEPIAPNIADQIPSGEKLRFQLLDQTQVNSFYDTLNLVKDLFVVLTILTVLCFAGALALSPRRWRTLALTGWLVFGGASVLMGMFAWGGGIWLGTSTFRSTGDTFLRLIPIIAVSGAFYFSLLLLAHSPEARDLLGAVRRKLG